MHKVVHMVVNTFEQGLKRWEKLGLSPSHGAYEMGFRCFCQNEASIFY